MAGCNGCGNDDGPYKGADGQRYCLDCLEAGEDRPSPVDTPRE